MSLPAAVLAAPAPAAGPEVQLRRVVTPRDAITIGLIAAGPAAPGRGEAVGRQGERLEKAGHITVWPHASGQPADGSPAGRPVPRVTVLRTHALHIKPYAPAPRVPLPRR